MTSKITRTGQAATHTGTPSLAEKSMTSVPLRVAFDQLVGPEAPAVTSGSPPAGNSGGGAPASKPDK